jgi:hypothetical protein
MCSDIPPFEKREENEEPRLLKQDSPLRKRGARGDLKSTLPLHVYFKPRN